MKIKEKYMWLFDNLDARNPICMFGIECNNGWERIIDKLFEEITYVDKQKSTRISQVKEKFGTLRVYYIHTKPIDDVVERLVYYAVTNAEYDSKRICEVCGEIGTLKQNGWHRVTCESCERKYQDDL